MYKILVIDDDPSGTELLITLLGLEGFQGSRLENWADPLADVERQRPDLVIFDLMMENMDSGFILSHRMRRTYPEVPIIIVSAVAQDAGMRFDTKSAEMKDWIKADVFLDKQIRPEQIQAEVSRLLHANR